MNGKEGSMAYTLDSLDITGLRATHFEQLWEYLLDAEVLGWYYGNKRQFDTRHKEIKEWLRDAIDQMRDPEARIPKKKPDSVLDD